MRGGPSSSQLAGAAHAAAQTLSAEDVSLGPISFRLPRFSGPSYTTVIVLVLSLLVAEQLRWRNKKRHLPGDTFTIPIIGRFLNSLRPTLANYKKGWQFDLSAVSVFHIFIVMAASTEYSRKILNAPTHAEPCLVASGKQVIMPDNWVFLSGKVHVDYRKGLNVLFTRRALASYLPVQEGIFRRFFERWIANPNPKPEPYQMEIRDLNMEVSLRIFCGSYIPSDAEREISDKYWLISKALELVNFPLALPGTKVYRAIQARKVAMRWFEHASAESKKRMATGAEPDCMLDKWVKAMLDARAAAADGGAEADAGEAKTMLVREYSDREIAMVLFSFLFASQDAMSSGLCYAFQLLADHPATLAKLRAEVDAARGTDTSAQLSFETLESMDYTNAVVKEVLRLRPPVLMVPYMTKRAFPITPDYTVPKGTMLIPSFWNSLHDANVYPDPDAFVPERWLDPKGPAQSNPKEYLVFGSGPHRCIGHDYAKMQIAAVISSAAWTMDWEHEVTDQSEEVAMAPTIFPLDGLRLKFSPRASPIGSSA